MSAKRKRTEDIDDIYNIEANFLSNSPTAATANRPVPKGTTNNGRVGPTKNIRRKPIPKQRARAASNRTTAQKSQPQRKIKKKSSVPDPPVSLVKLLRKDKKVLNYFTALQQSLDRDVQTWKEKALEYKSELREQKRVKLLEDKKEGKDNDNRGDGDKIPVRTIHVSKFGTGDDDGSSLEINADSHSVDRNGDGNDRDKVVEQRKVHAQKLASSNDDHSSHRSLERENASKSDQKGTIIDKIEMEEVAFTDELANELFAMSSSGSSSSSSTSTSHTPTIITREAIHSRIEEKKAQKCEIRSEVITYLIEAYDNLQKLGVWLTDVNVSKKSVHLPVPTIETQETEKQCKANIGHDDTNLKPSDSSSSSDDDTDTGFFCNTNTNKPRKDTCSTEVNSTSTAEIKGNTPSSITRRSDILVVTDLMRAIRSFIRLPTSGMKNADSSADPCLQPFLGTDLIPCCYTCHANPPTSSKDKISSDESTGTTPADGLSSFMDEIPHPAGRGFLLVARSLMVIDTYASPNSPFAVEGEWETLFESSNTSTVDEDDNTHCQRREKLEHICIGMRNRNITSMLLQSLDGEISRYWAVADRAIRETTTVLINEQPDGSDDYDSSDSSSGMDPLLNDNDLTPKKSEESFSSKSLIRLFSLAERICYARLVSFLHQYRSDIQEAGRLVIDYILSTCPSPIIEDYPRYPPTMSMCILEALLSRIKDGIFLQKDVDNDSYSPTFSWFFHFLQKMAEIPSSEGTNDNSNQPLLHVSLMCNVCAAANVWQKRQSSTDKRVRDISRVEIAAYKRLLRSESDWLVHHHELQDSIISDNSNPTITKSLEVVEKAQKLLLPNQSDINLTCSFMPLNGVNGKAIDAYLSMQSSLLLMGDHALAVNICKDALSRYDGTSSWSEIFIHTLPPVIVTCFKVHTDLQCRNWESYRLRSSDTGDMRADQLAPSEENQNYNMPCLVDKMISMLNCKYPICEDKNRTETARMVPVSTMLRCCLILSDAIRANCITKISLRNPSKSRAKRVDELRMIIDIGEHPSVRVINLKSRPDRWNNFMIQAQREQLLTVRAVATLAEKGQDLPQDDDQLYWGSHAYDGTNIGQLGFEKRMQPYLGSNEVITKLVEQYWSPKKLKAFDSLARDDVEQVLMNPSERACALSHLASWIGVKRSLHCTIKDMNSSKPGQSKKDCHLLRMLKISGFARGASICIENSNIPPTPVCIILEDDAVLVDRFSDRLSLLLDELPRDFHFCSLGYGRPKNAPMIKYASQIGIPTCIWYLTGYVISLAGANHLLESLPVQGPVDSWIGMKMMTNWDNSFGHRIGITSNTKAQVDRDKLPDKKDLKNIMKFRCFAALTPLCSQKVGASTSTSTTDKNRWRQRDTDIMYSGHGWTRK